MPCPPGREPRLLLQPGTSPLKPCKKLTFATEVLADFPSVKSNATSSPLLKLPRELREKIWAYLFADQLVHIEFAPTQRKRHAVCNRRSFITWSDDLKADRRLDYVLCEATVSEQEAYELSRTQEEGNSVESREPDKISFRERHADCYRRRDEGFNMPYARIGTHDTPTGSSTDHKHVRRNQLPLAFLRVCRQAYLETNTMFWRTTTWSFTSPRAFYRFMCECNPVQRRLMSKLHLNFYDFLTRAVFDDWYQFMTSKKSMSMMQKFQALEVLHLDVRSWRDNRDAYRRFGEWPVSSVAEVLSEVYYLPLKTVTVICTGTITRCESSSSGLWVPGDTRLLSDAENSKLAEEIRVQLLDHHGAAWKASWERNRAAWNRKMWTTGSRDLRTLGLD